MLRGVTLTGAEARTIIDAVNVRCKEEISTIWTVQIDGPGDLPQVHRVHAAYFRHEDGWVTFKDGAHKVISAFRAASVQKIDRVDLCTVKDGSVSAKITVDWGAVQAEAREVKPLTTDDYIRIASKHARVSV